MKNIENETTSGTNSAEDKQNSAPDITVIVSVWNRADIVGRCLAALEKQEAKSTFEVVVVDDGSEDDTNNILTEYLERGQLDLRVVKHKTHRNLAAARNTGLRHARGRIVLFLDADIVAKPNVIDTHMSYHRRYPDNNVAILGNVEIPEEWRGSPLVEMSNCAQMWRDLKPNGELPWWNFFGGHISAKKDFVLSVGGFDEQLMRCQDIEIARRLFSKGLRLIYANDAVAYHYHQRKPHELVDNAEAYAQTMARLYVSGDPLMRNFVAKQKVFDRGIKASAKYLLAWSLCNRVFLRPTLCVANWLADSYPSIATLLTRMLCYKVYQDAFQDKIGELVRSKP